MSGFSETALPAVGNPPAPTRAVRLAKFKREQLVVDFLNRGVSVAEIAARMGLSETRTRAVIRDPRTGHGCPEKVSGLNSTCRSACRAEPGKTMRFLGIFWL